MDNHAQEALPAGWSKSSIGEITLSVQRIDPLDNPQREIDYIDISSIDNVRNVVGDVKRFRLKDAPSRARQIIRAGDVLFATVRPYLKNIAAVPEKLHGKIASTGFAVLRPASGIEPRFLFYKATSTDFVNALSVEQYGVSYPAVTDDQVREQRILVPPYSEQLRIVTKIDELFSELDKGVENLKIAQQQLRVYRQAVLKHAFEGKLTTKWRRKNAQTLETRHQLIARINNERAKSYQNELNTYTSGDKSVGRSTKPYKLPPLTEASDIPNASLPQEWLTLRVQGLCEIVDGDRGANYPKRNHYSAKGFCLFLSAKNVTKTGFSFSECQFISEAKHRALRKGTVEIGDIVFTSRGTIGNVAYHAKPLDFEAIRINSGMFILRRYEQVVTGAYLRWLLVSPIVTQQIKKLNSGTAQPQLPIGEFEKFKLPVPSISEQNAVVERLDEQITNIDAIEADIKTELVGAEMLRQSILKAAFSGWLVAQDPNDEPASSLIERIRGEKAKNENGKRKTIRKDAA